MQTAFRYCLILSSLTSGIDERRHNHQGFIPPNISGVSPEGLVPAAKSHLPDVSSHSRERTSQLSGSLIQEH